MFNNITGSKQKQNCISNVFTLLNISGYEDYILFYLLWFITVGIPFQSQKTINCKWKYFLGFVLFREFGRGEKGECPMGQFQGNYHTNVCYIECLVPHHIYNFGNYIDVVFVFSCSVVCDSATLWTIACQAPLSMGFFRQEYWSKLPFPHPWDLPDSGIESVPPVSPALAGRSFTHWAIHRYIDI